MVARPLRPESVHDLGEPSLIRATDWEQGEHERPWVSTQCHRYPTESNRFSNVALIATGSAARPLAEDRPHSL